ncbi:hypothetical protein EYF80_044734 [Liparis tanakae]|uniref:Uncharacterized protein n=1 Tax=Liparis tanakae TaxID=230148 RepID=A0A4Z2FW85_9TELE|nr:hypothetical protein EYF80_044734 [Liparis tanakae]
MNAHANARTPTPRAVRDELYAHCEAEHELDCRDSRGTIKGFSCSTEGKKGDGSHSDTFGRRKLGAGYDREERIRDENEREK